MIYFFLSYFFFPPHDRSDMEANEGYFLGTERWGCSCSYMVSFFMDITVGVCWRRRHFHCVVLSVGICTGFGCWGSCCVARRTSIFTGFGCCVTLGTFLILLIYFSPLVWTTIITWVIICSPLHIRIHIVWGLIFTVVILRHWWM